MTMLRSGSLFNFSLLGFKILLVITIVQQKYYVGYSFTTPAFSSSIAFTTRTTTNGITQQLPVGVQGRNDASFPSLQMVSIAKEQELLNRGLFKKYCDGDETMTKKILAEDVLFVSDLLRTGDLLEEELNDIWTTVAKIASKGKEERIGADSFVQIFREIDSLFEDDGDDEEENSDDKIEKSELETVFKSLSGGNNIITKVELKKWEDFSYLLNEEKTLTENEFEMLWKKSTESSNEIDLEGFMRINAELDDLFEDEEDEAADAAKTTVETPRKPRDVVEDEGLDPKILFNSIADPDDLLIGQEELKLWGELNAMIADGDILQNEVDTLCMSVARDESKSWNVDGKLNEAGFIELCKRIDNLFDDDEGGEDDNEQSVTLAAPAAVASAAKTVVETPRKPVASAAKTVVETPRKPRDVVEEEGLDPKVLFYSLADPDDLLIGQDELKLWGELNAMIVDGDILQSELDTFCMSIARDGSKSWNVDGKLNEAGFIELCKRIDNLFDDDEGGEDDNEQSATLAAPAAAVSPAAERKVVEEEGLEPSTLFYSIADPESLVVGPDELKLWGELNSMITDGEIIQKEVDAFCKSIVRDDTKPWNTDRKLNEAGFIELCKRIDNLFEEEGGGNDSNNQQQDTVEPTAVQTGEAAARKKEELLDILDYLNNEIKDRVPCGFESEEVEDKEVISILEGLESDKSCNVMSQLNLGVGVDADATKLKLKEDYLAGTWELLYTTSSAMKWNKGVSGIAGSFPNGKFGGLTQKLTCEAYGQINDVEYKERVNVLNNDVASFDVTIDGGWDLFSQESLFTGKPVVSLKVLPDNVMYGGTSTRGDHWKSLGPTNMLDITYLDNDLRIMRGNTSTDSVFVFRKIK